MSETNEDTEQGHDIKDVPLLQRQNIKLSNMETLLLNGTIFAQEYYFAFDVAKLYIEYTYTHRPNYLEVYPVAFAEQCKPEDNVSCGTLAPTLENSLDNIISNADKVTELKNPEKKTVIVGIEVMLYPNDNRIAKIIGIYYTDIMSIYDFSTYQAIVDGDINYDHFGFINPLFIERFEYEPETYNGIIGENISGGRKVMLKAPLGYALNGISYLVNNILWRDDINIINPVTKETFQQYLPLNQATTKLVLRFAKVYDRNAPFVYSGIMNNIVYDEILETDTANVPVVRADTNLQYVSTYYPSKTTFIQSIEFIYLPRLDAKDIELWLKLLQYGMLAYSIIPQIHIFRAILPDLKEYFTDLPSEILSENSWKYIGPQAGPYLLAKLAISLFSSNVFESMWDAFLERIKILDKSWYREDCYGFKGISRIQTLQIDTTPPENFYKWISAIDNIKTCDFDPDNWYDTNTVEFIYAKFIKDQYVNTISPFIYIPSQICVNNILKPYCTINVSDTDSYDRFREMRCEQYCALDDTDCDASLKTYCHYPPILNDTNTNGENPKDLYIKKELKYSYKFYLIDQVDKMKETVILYNIKNLTQHEVCGCLIDDEPEYLSKMYIFYNTILNLYTQTLNTVTSNTDKVKIQKEIDNIKIIIDEIPLYDIMGSFKDSLKQKIKPDKISDILRNNQVKKECSLPSCRQAKYKLKSMKLTQCNQQEDCIGNGFIIPITTEDDSKILCQYQNRIDVDICVQPLEPKLSLVPDLNNFSVCRNVLDTEYQYSDVIVPSECKLTNTFGSVGCVDGKMRKVKDIILPEYPPGSSVCPPEGVEMEKLVFDGRCIPITNKETKPVLNLSTNGITLIVVFVVLIIFFIFLLKFYKKQ